ncbi:MAG: UDP-N-acetylmuramate dehydrogenase [Propionibacterium sp.]
METDVSAAGACDVRHDTAALPGGDTADSPLLSEHTSFHIGGPAKNYVVARTEAELIDAVCQADAGGEPLLVLSGGTNMLVGDDGFPGTVVRVASRGLDADVSGCGGAVVTVQAGEDWDALVAHCVEQEWSGAETLAGIPGLVGATPVQNVGAYGSDVGQFVYRVRTWDRREKGYRTFANADCAFGYRDSVFKHERMAGSPTGRFVVLEVTFQFLLGNLSQPIAYAELARRLGVSAGDRAPASTVREEVLSLRRGKGMVVDPDDHDTWSAGSFFMNPLVDAATAARLPAEAPRFPQPDGRIKTSAAWLIDHAGFHKGYGSGEARLSDKHTLALTNRGSAHADDILALAREIRTGVGQRFGIELSPEPNLIACSL